MQELFLREGFWSVTVALIGVLLLQWRSRSSNKKTEAETEKIRKETEKISFELTNNHGSSTKDAVDRIELMVGGLQQQQRVIREEQETLREEVKAVIRFQDAEAAARKKHERESGVWRRNIEATLTPLTAVSADSPFED